MGTNTQRQAETPILIKKLSPNYLKEKSVFSNKVLLDMQATLKGQAPSVEGHTRLAQWHFGRFYVCMFVCLFLSHVALFLGTLWWCMWVVCKKAWNQWHRLQESREKRKRTHLLENWGVPLYLPPVPHWSMISHPLLLAPFDWLARSCAQSSLVSTCQGDLHGQPVSSWLIPPYSLIMLCQYIYFWTPQDLPVHYGSKFGVFIVFLCVQLCASAYIFVSLFLLWFLACSFVEVCLFLIYFFFLFTCLFSNKRKTRKGYEFGQVKR